MPTKWDNITIKHGITSERLYIWEMIDYSTKGVAASGNILGKKSVSLPRTLYHNKSQWLCIYTWKQTQK